MREEINMVGNLINGIIKANEVMKKIANPLKDAGLVYPRDIFYDDLEIGMIKNVRDILGYLANKDVLLGNYNAKMEKLGIEDALRPFSDACEPYKIIEQFYPNHNMVLEYLYAMRDREGTLEDLLDYLMSESGESDG
jgi:hypothetical protein